MNPCVINRPELFKPGGLSPSDVESLALVPGDRGGPVLGALLYAAEDTVSDVVTGGVGGRMVADLVASANLNDPGPSRRSVSGIEVEN
jgi:hypothetical protein